ncbi:RNA 2',3'-cyclic phosphodiesterase [Acidaminobacter hydrogenoformans]|uniref:RNA 2',3'-cyclic phosphodiesterase n=1 Tax=Acidaminobacter hydrogenoformans DSM 2784 TaxID=1120920 RepID=A0A1G5S5U1_9FIRM|nr:RNA 2',3'-cyclic phosphodiesterase [Acidaminobacter hydrogenoformans]SCZ81477.1 2'-5' RNA ligase [Acidaminobacter hydrogenoformans DSM 2784]
MRMQEGKVIKGRAVDSGGTGAEGAVVLKRRLFIGIELPPAVKSRIYKAARPALDKIKKGKLTDKDNFHLTVFFIGEVPAEEVSEWEDCVARAAAENQGFDITLCHTGYFSRKNRKILWFGSEDSVPLEMLYKSVLSAADSVLLRHEKPMASAQPGANRPFKPHVTLGREISAEDEAVVVRTEKIKLKVEALTLFESKRATGRLAYMPIARFRLGERV